MPQSAHHTPTDSTARLGGCTQHSNITLQQRMGFIKGHTEAPACQGKRHAYCNDLQCGKVVEARQCDSRPREQPLQWDNIGRVSLLVHTATAHHNSSAPAGSAIKAKKSQVLPFLDTGGPRHQPKLCGVAVGKCSKTLHHTTHQCRPRPLIHYGWGVCPKAPNAQPLIAPSAGRGLRTSNTVC